MVWHANNAFNFLFIVVAADARNIRRDKQHRVSLGHVSRLRNPFSLALPFNTIPNRQFSHSP